MQRARTLFAPNFHCCTPPQRGRLQANPDIFYGCLLDAKVEEYYVYRAGFLDTVESVARMFGMTYQQLFDANPQWKGKPMLLTRLRLGEEIYLPASIEKTTPFFLIHASKLEKRRGFRPTVAPVRSNYPPNWFPPRPAFGSPSSQLSTLLRKLGNPKYKIGTRPDGKSTNDQSSFPTGGIPDTFQRFQYLSSEAFKFQ